MSDGSPTDGTRRERKERTRQRILDAALALSAEGGLSTVSLRQVAREVGIVPTAFYRHFESVEDLGLVLVDESFVSLRAMLREVRREAIVSSMIPATVEVLERHVLGSAGHFRFIARERMTGPGMVRVAIRHELELCQRELSTDIARVRGVEDWGPEDLNVLSGLMVNLMVASADELLEASGPAARREIANLARRQLMMVVVGAMHWKPSGLG